MTDQAVNILVVDDDEVDVMNVRRALEKSHVTNPLYVAHSGVEALAMLREGTIPPHGRLVLLDINMPRMNGIEFLREVRADPDLKSLCVVVLTTSNEDQDRLDAHDLDVAGYLLKPVTFASFVETVVALKKHWTLVERS